MNYNYKVGIVVVTYNRLKLLQDEIDSLRNQTYKNTQIIVVNNSSTDGTLEWLEQQKDIVTITQGNVGGAGGFHTGMKYVAEHSFDLCWIMDDDVFCHEDALEKLIVAYSKYPESGFICSKVIGIDGVPMNLPSIDYRSGDNGYSNWCNESDDFLLRVTHATFVSVLIPCKIIDHVGLPYKEYFIWGDDMEYTERISTNLTCFYCLNSIVIHKRAIQKKVSIESETNSSRLQNFVYSIRNHTYNFMKFKHVSRIRCELGMLKEIFKCTFSGKLKELSIRVKALKQFHNFNPKVEFPQK